VNFTPFTDLNVSSLHYDCPRMIDDPIVRYALAGAFVLLVLTTAWSFREQFVRSGAVGAFIARWRTRCRGLDRDNRLRR